MRIRNAVAAVVLGAVALAACGSGDDEPAAEEMAGESSSTADSDTADSGEAATGDRDLAEPGSGRPESVRDDYPVPFPAGWEIDVQGEIGMTDASGAQLLYPSDAFDEIVAFYDEWFASQPDEFARTEAGDEVLYQLLDPDLYHQVWVTPHHEERGQTWVLLQVFGGPVN